MSSKIIEDLVARCKALGVSGRKLSMKAGLTATYMWQLENGKANPKSATIDALDSALRVLEKEAGIESPPKRKQSLPSVDTSTVWVDELDVSASAGYGALQDYESAVEKWGIPRYLFESTVGSPSQTRVITVQGDSMTPTLSDGDKVLIDTLDRDPSTKPGLYVIYDDGLLVKRVSVANGRWLISSDNKLYQEYSAEKDTVQIMGWVVAAINRF